MVPAGSSGGEVKEQLQHPNRALSGEARENCSVGKANVVPVSYTEFTPSVTPRLIQGNQGPLLEFLVSLIKNLGMDSNGSSGTILLQFKRKLPRGDGGDGGGGAMPFKPAWRSDPGGQVGTWEGRRL